MEFTEIMQSIETEEYAQKVIKALVSTTA